MIQTDTTRFIIRKLNAQAEVEAAAQAIVDEENRRAAAQASYTVEELLELIALAEECDDVDTAGDLACDLLFKDRDHDYVRIYGWCTARRVMKRPADVPWSVRVITYCTCDGGECSYCTCCELWNGEHSCEYGRRHDPIA